jgi:hypothetical protein
MTDHSAKEFEKDAERRFGTGWELEAQTEAERKVAVGKTLGKAALTGGLGLLLSGRSKKAGNITATWVKP